MGYGQAAVLLLLLYYTDADVQMTGPSTYTATLGSEARIPCTFTIVQPLTDSKLFAVFWYYRGSVILGTDGLERYNTSKYSMDRDQALNGIANLMISDISVTDNGSYICSVSHERLQQHTIDVTVQAVPKITVVNDVVMTRKKSFLCCEISGFYPVDITITWLRDGVALDNVLEGKIQNNPNGTYSLNSSIILMLTEEDRERNFSCRVQHVSLLTPLNKDLQLKYEDEKMSHTDDCERFKVAIIILAVLLGLAIITIITIIYFLCKKTKKPTDANIPMNPVQRNDRENANAEEENDPQHAQIIAEERQVLNQEQPADPRQQDTAL